MPETNIVAICMYSIPLFLIALMYLEKRRRIEMVNANRLQDAIDSGLTEPASLHPLIDPGRCIGCGACMSACPERTVIGLIGGKATLVNPADCIGHGACKQSCPHDAIKLVFGTERRGVEIPCLTPSFETTVPGIYVAGELGGMGLVKNAIEQGKQAMMHIGGTLERSRKNACEWDAIIVGCGPAGISAALQAKQQGTKALAIDRHKIGGTVAHFPRMKMVMTAPADLPGVGKVKFNEIQKEDLIAFWRQVVARQRPKVHQSENLTGIARLRGGGFKVRTDKATYRSRTVLLAMGRRGTPRKLEVPGEELGKVVYELEDAAQYVDKKVLVVGGGDSALEAAIATAQHSPGNVTLCYRGEAFSRAKSNNRERIQQLAAEKRIRIFLSTVVKEIRPTSVILKVDGRLGRIANDHVIICAGGVLPTGFLKELGIKVVTKYGEA